MINTIIFDLDGTLINSALICVEIINEMLHERGSKRHVAVDDAAPYLSHGGLFLVTSLLGQDCRVPEAELILFRKHYIERPTPQNSLFQGVHAGLQELSSAGFRMAICSNKPEYLCHKIVADLQISKHFESIIGEVEGRRSKPATDMVNIILKELAVAAASCIFVGDSEVDCATAEASGIPFILMTYGYGYSSAQPHAINSFGTFSDLVTHIKGIRSAEC
jgi:phosphoglycolate phosphatase